MIKFLNVKKTQYIRITESLRLLIYYMILEKPETTLANVC